MFHRHTPIGHGSTHGKLIRIKSPRACGFALRPTLLSANSGGECAPSATTRRPCAERETLYPSRQQRSQKWRQKSDAVRLRNQLAWRTVQSEPEPVAGSGTVSLKVTPAMVAGVTSKLWEMSNMVKVLEDWETTRHVTATKNVEGIK